MRNYLKLLFGVCTSVLLLIAAFNAIVDPYRIVGSNWFPRYTQFKPRIGDHAMIGKPAAVWRKRPTAIVLGTSRENHGIDPEHTGWSAPAGTRYNLGMDDGHIADAERLFEHALAVSDVRQVILGLEFLNMFDARVIKDSDLDPDLVASKNRSPILAMLSVGRYLLSAAALSDSVYTIKHQQAILDDFELDGRRNEHLFERGVAHVKSQRKMCVFSEWNNFIKSRRDLAVEQRFQERTDDGTTTLSILGRILDLAAAHNIDIRLTIVPVHARQLETYRALGLADRFEQWKRELVKVAQGEEYRTTRMAFPLWDFADYNSVTVENVPEPRDETTRMRWYWESTHFKKVVGDWMLDRMFGCKCSGQESPEGFGVRLTAEGIDEHLQSIRERASAYATTHPTDVNEIAHMVADGVLP